MLGERIHSSCGRSVATGWELSQRHRSGDFFLFGVGGRVCLKIGGPARGVDSVQNNKPNRGTARLDFSVWWEGAELHLQHHQ